MAEWTPVSSSNLHSVRYDPDKAELFVQFKNGKIYRYSGVSAAEHADLMEADSAGSHFASNIRGRYDGVEV
jgi:hypothetical protein